MNRIMIEVMRAAILVASAISGVTGWYFFIAPTPLSAVIVVAMVIAAIGFQFYRDTLVARMAAEDATRDIIEAHKRMRHQETRERNTKTRMMLPEEVLADHTEMVARAQTALSQLESAVKYSKAAAEGLAAVNNQMVSMQTEINTLREEASKLDAIGTILSGVDPRGKSLPPEHVHPEVARYGERHAPPAPQIEPAGVPSFLSAKEPVNLDQLEAALSDMRMVDEEPHR